MSSRRQGGASSVSSRTPRQSTTTPAPAPSRQRNATTTPAAGGSATRPAQFALPPYQTPAAPLTADAQQALNAILSRTHPINKINDHLKRASAALEESTSEINERLTERDAIVKRRKVKRAKEGVEDDELDEKENADLAAMKNKVEGMTARLETAMRKCVDGEKGLENLEKTLKELSRSAANAAQTASQQQSAQQQLQHRNSRPDNDDGAEEPDTSTPEVTQPGTAQSQPQPPETLPPPPSLAPAFTSSLQTHTDAYTSLSLRTRYSQHPAYVSFKKLTWDARHPSDEAPPMPHASTWFAAEEETTGSPAPGVTGTQPRAHDAASASASANADAASDDSADDIAVARVRISTRCPLTLREFVDPVTSSTCGHSFERATILLMIAQQRPPTRARGQPPVPAGWAPAVQCPVSGCSCEFRAEDLVTDKVLARRIKRIQRAREMVGVGGSDAVEAGDGDATMIVDNDGEEEGSGEEVDEVEDDQDEEVEEQPTARRRGRRVTSDEIEDDD